MYDQSYVDTINNAIENIADYCRKNEFKVIKKYGKYTIKYKDRNEILTWLYPCVIHESGAITYKNYDAYNDIDGEAVCYIWEDAYLLYAEDYIEIFNLINHYNKELNTEIIAKIVETKNIDNTSYTYNDLLEIALNNRTYTEILFNHCDKLEADDYFKEYLDIEFILVDFENECYLLYTDGLNCESYIENMKPKYPDLNEEEILYAELASQYGEYPPETYYKKYTSD
ncbi:MAG: hypothetical protein LUG12_12970 [Erysipelotrichaceae bacterium]|nr:hypothetical protein [Erysipelotrichaceae bacterium]